MTRFEVSEPRYELFHPFFTYGGLSGPLLEAAADWGKGRDHVPRPLDILASAGNLWVGFVVAATVLLTAVGLQVRRNKAEGFVDRGAETFSQEWVRRTRIIGVPVAIAVTVLLNCSTETQWGVENLPFAMWAGGITPDSFDLIHSALWSGVAAALPWQRVRRSVWREV